jgi:hypothetical protein
MRLPLSACLVHRELLKQLDQGARVSNLALAPPPAGSGGEHGQGAEGDDAEGESMNVDIWGGRAAQMGMRRLASEDIAGLLQRTTLRSAFSSRVPSTHTFGFSAPTRPSVSFKGLRVAHSHTPTSPARVALFLCC